MLQNGSSYSYMRLSGHCLKKKHYKVSMLFKWENFKCRELSYQNLEKKNLAKESLSLDVLKDFYVGGK